MKGIRQRKGGTWFADYRTDGRRIRKFFAPGQDGRRAAIAFLTARRAQVTLGQHPGKPRPVPTFADFASEYLRYLRGLDRRAKTLEGAEAMIRVHLTPVFGPVPLDRITKDSVISFFAEKRETPVRHGPKGTPCRPALRTVDKMREVLGLVLGHAVYRDLLPTNVVRAVHPLASASTADEAMHTLTPGEIRRLLAVAQEPYRTLYETAIGTGMRRGELLALRWRHVNLATSQLYVAAGRQRVKDGNRYIVQDGPVKTRAGRRTIDLSPDLQARLLTFPAGDDPEQDYVFRNRDGGPLDPDNLDRRFKRDLTLANLPPIRFHDLRHTHASLLIAARIHPKAIQARLGHASIKVTMDTYGHLMASGFTGIGAKLDALLADACPISRYAPFSRKCSP